LREGGEGSIFWISSSFWEYSHTRVTIYVTPYRCNTQWNNIHKYQTKKLTDSKQFTTWIKGLLSNKRLIKLRHMLSRERVSSWKSFYMRLVDLLWTHSIDIELLGCDFNRFIYLKKGNKNSTEEISPSKWKFCTYCH